MTVFYYSFWMLVLLALLTINLNVKKKQRNWVVVSTIVFLSLLAGLRYGNADYKAYEEMFANPWVLSADKGFSLLIAIVKLVATSPLFMFILVAFVAVSLNILSYRKYSPYLFVSVLFYFVHSFLLKEYVQIRAGLSSAICLYSIRYIENRNVRKYILCTIIAMSIQFSSIIFFPLYWLYHLMNHKNDKYLLLFLLISCMIGMLFPLGQILKEYVFLFDGSSRLAVYASWETFSEEIGIFTNMTTVKQIVLCIFCYIYKDRLKDQIYCFSPLYLSYIFSTCWLMLFNDFSIVGARMAAFLSIGEPIFFAGILGMFSRQSRIVALSFFIMFSYMVMDMNLHTKTLGKYCLYPFTSLI